MARTNRVIYHEEAERELLFSGAWRERIGEVGDRIATDAREHAPVAAKSKGGALSISSAVDLHPKRGWQAKVSWDRRHYYMTFPENGTIYQAERPFLRPALKLVRNI